MIIGRGRHREHPQPTLFTTTTGVAQLPVVHHPREPRKESSDLRSHPVAMILLLRKKRGKSRSCAEPASGEGHFRTWPLPVTWLTSLPVKRPYYACAEHTSGQGTWLTSLPVMWLTSFQSRNFRSRHFRSRDFRLHPLTAPPQMLTELYPYTTGGTLRIMMP